MHPTKILFTTLSLFALAVTGNPLNKRTNAVDNYNTLKTAMGSTAPVVGKSYAVYEYWSPSSENALCNSITNKLSHAGLVVGKVTQGTSGPEFTATRYDMVKDGADGTSSTGSSLTKAGGSLCSGTLPLVTVVDTNTKYVNAWHRDTTHTYKYAGEITAYNPPTMEAFAKDYCNENPNYNLFTNSCQTFAKNMYKAYKKDA